MDSKEPAPLFNPEKNQVQQNTVINIALRYIQAINAVIHWPN